MTDFFIVHPNKGLSINYVTGRLSPGRLIPYPCFFFFRGFKANKITCNSINHNICSNGTNIIFISWFNIKSKWTFSKLYFSLVRNVQKPLQKRSPHEKYTHKRKLITFRRLIVIPSFLDLSTVQASAISLKVGSVKGLKFFPETM